MLPFLLSETPSKNAAFLPDKACAWGTSGRYEGVLRGSHGVVIAIGDARSAWRGCWRFGLQRNRAGRHKDALRTLQIVPRDYKIFPSAWEENGDATIFGYVTPGRWRAGW